MLIAQGQKHKEMPARGTGLFGFCKDMAKHILHTRMLRRKLGVQVLLVLMVLFSLGVFVLEAWLESNIWLFTSFWALIFVLTSILLFLAFYDALRVVGEVKDEHNKEVADNLRELAEQIRVEQEKAGKRAQNGGD